MPGVAHGVLFIREQPINHLPVCLGRGILREGLLLRRVQATVELRREAPVILARYVPRVNSYVVASATGTASDQVP